MYTDNKSTTCFCCVDFCPTWKHAETSTQLKHIVDLIPMCLLLSAAGAACQPGHSSVLVEYLPRQGKLAEKVMSHQNHVLQSADLPSVACDGKGGCCCTRANCHSCQASTEQPGIHLGSGTCTAKEMLQQHKDTRLDTHLASYHQCCTGDAT